MINRDMLPWIMLATLAASVGAKRVINIGLLRDQTAKTFWAQELVNLTLTYVNDNTTLLPDVELRLITDSTRSSLDMLEHIQKAYEMLEHNCSILIGPRTSTATRAAQLPLAAAMVPQIAPVATDPLLATNQHDFPFLLRMSSPDNTQNQAILALMQLHGWSKFSILHEDSDYGRNGAQELVTMAAKRYWTVVTQQEFYALLNPEEIEVTDHLEEIKYSGSGVVVMYCHSEYAWVILEHADTLGMVERGWAWLVPDGVTSGLPPGFSNAQGGDEPDDFQTVPRRYQGLLGTSFGTDFGDLYPIATELIQQLDPDAMKTVSQNFLMRYFDAAIVATYGIRGYIEAGYDVNEPRFQPELCLAEDIYPWEEGGLLFTELQKVQTGGAMNVLNFTSENSPWSVSFDILNMRQDGWNTIGHWWPQYPGLSLSSPVYFPGGTWEAPSEITSIDNLTLTVVTLLEPPFVMYNPTARALQGHSYVGYCIDLLEELRKVIDFDYHLHLVADGQYGSRDPVTQQWDGLLREIIEQRADLAVAPLIITELRNRFVEFTTPFMDLSFNVLVPVEAPAFRLFAFLDPFESNLWLGVGAATVVFGFVIGTCSYLSPFGWHGRYAQRRHVSDHRHRARRHYLGFHHSFWFSIASLMKQGPENMPFSLSGRLAAGVWWGAAMIFGASYTANLAAFLTVARLNTGITSLTDLGTQKEMLYGTVKGSVTDLYFKQQRMEPFPQMYTVMTSFDTWETDRDSGIARVRNSSSGNPDKYAFIYDSVSLNYASLNPPCTTRTLATSFGQLGFGFALPKNSPRKAFFDQHIQVLRENGFLEQLADKWITGNCDTGSEDTSAGLRFSLNQMAGIFVLLLGGVVIAMVTVLLEYIIAAQRDVIMDRQDRIPNRGFWFHLKRRFNATGDAIRESLSCEQYGPVEEKETNKIRNDQYQTKYMRHEYSDVGASFPPAGQRKSLSAIAAAERRKSITMYENMYGGQFKKM